MYADIAAAARNEDLRNRIAGCLSSLGRTDPHPLGGADQIQWAVVGKESIADAYAYAVATNVPNPGRDEAVVTDAAILAAVDAIVNPAPVEGE